MNLPFSSVRDGRAVEGQKLGVPLCTSGKKQGQCYSHGDNSRGPGQRWKLEVCAGQKEPGEGLHADLLSHDPGAGRLHLNPCYSYHHTG